MERTDVLKALVVGCFALLLLFGCIQPPVVPPAGNGTNNTGNASLQPGAGLKQFASLSELKAYLGKGGQYGGYGYREGIMTALTGAQGTAVPTAAPAKSGDSSGGSSDYSTTNIQVEGVDEADFVKSDGKYLYILSGSKLVIVDAYPAEGAKILSETNVTGSPEAMFVNGDSVVVFGGSGYYYNTSILQYNVSDRSKPSLARNISVEGTYSDSRMIGSYVYAVINKYVYYYYGYGYADDAGILPPAVSVSTGRGYYQLGGGTAGGMPPVYYFEDEPGGSCRYTTILSMDISSPEGEPVRKTFLMDSSQDLYVSTENMYVTYVKPQYYAATPLDVVGTVVSKIMPMPSPVPPREYTEETQVRRIAIKGGQIEYAAGGSVPGHVLNQFSMDESNGYFRVATTLGSVSRMAGASTSSNNVYVLDMNLSTVGKLEGLAPGETIYSARFMGDRAYLVTFRKVDPLFVIDLAEPSAPKMLGKLKIPGYSDYLHPYDETHLIGLGKDAIPSEEGDFSWYQGVKLSLFDVSNVSSPIELASYKIGDRGTDSEALQDHKAFLFSRSKDLLVVPILLAKMDKSRYAGGYVEPWQYGDYVFQGAYVFNVTTDKGFVLKGTVSHVEDNSTFDKSGYYYSGSEYSVRRSLYIGDTLYTLSDKRLKANSLGDMSEVKSLALPYESLYYGGPYYGV